MEKKIVGLIGAIATLGAIGSAEAAPSLSQVPSEVLKANTFAELLEPIPNAAALLQAVDESGPATSNSDVELVQYYHHHHHHHHHSQYRRYVPRVIVVPPRYRQYHHHHHHHHHHSFYRRDY